MTRDELEHAIRAACDVANDNELIVIGSQAILGQFPDAPAALRQSMEVDVIPSKGDAVADRIEGVLGELSLFHQTHGFYVHGVSFDTAILPLGWKDRLIDVRPDEARPWVGRCLGGYDLAASKLAAFRDKDRDFVRVLISTQLLTARTLADRVQLLPLSAEEIERRVRWVEQTARDVDA